MAKPRINMRLREDLWEAVKRVARERGIDRTAVVEECLERGLLGRGNGQLLPGLASPKLRAGGVKPRPKARRR